MTVVMKSSMEPAQMIASARRQVLALDPTQPIYSLRTMEQVRADSIAPQRLNLTLLGLFAALALVLAAVGVHSVMAYRVTQRTQEIGLRLALGAGTGEVLKMVVGQGVKLVVLGSSFGLILALATSRLLSSLLYGVTATDTLTFAGMSLMVLLVAPLASWIPARRATKVDPIVALRSE
jgi:putative ABC transport system permease protein